MKGCLGLFFCLLLTGCGYHFGIGNSLLTGKTLAIPYVVGDQDGSLTAAIIKEVSTSSAVSYTNGCADLTLQVSVVDFYEENVGFRYDRKKYGQIKKYIIPIETRATLIVQVELLDSSCCRILGPVNIKASIDFDHDYYSSRNGVNIFSLGQLSDIDSAEDAMRKPLNRALAEKVADFLNNAW